jgi:hypothetical protein
MAILVKEVPSDMLFQQRKTTSAFRDVLDLVLKFHNGWYFVCSTISNTFAELAGRIRVAAAELNQLLFQMCYLNLNIDMRSVWLLTVSKLNICRLVNSYYTRIIT